MSNNDPLNEYSEVSQALQKELDAVKILQDVEAGFFWDSLSYEDKCNAFHAVVSKICEGELEHKGSYRFILYDIFGFEPDMYIRAMNCGFMDLHNSISIDEK